ncbi:Nuclear actin-protein involved in chromatin remodeling, partial [Nowakowskiella sp. JEL0078]
SFSNNTVIQYLSAGSTFEFNSNIVIPYDPEGIAQENQIHLNVERIRVPEVLFQPGIIGLEQAGLPELLYDLIRNFETDSQKLLTQNVFLTGGTCLLPNFRERLELELRAIRPTSNPIGIFRDKDPLTGAWRGAAQWANTEREEFIKSSITREKYLECGSEYLTEHRFGNKV